MKIPVIHPRRSDAHKGDFGRVLIIGGSRGMSGAVALSGMAALHSGAGLVTLAVPERCLETVAAFHPCYMPVPIKDDANGCMVDLEQVTDLVAKSNCVAIGPGLGRTTHIENLVSHVYATCPAPLLVDADGLNALAATKVDLSSAAGPRILTPHVGEFRRLVGQPELEPSACREQASKLAAEKNVVILLKGKNTLITDGERIHENQTGNPGMATGGSGDVLTGVIVALLGQGYSPMEAAVLGAHVHGLAGDQARNAVGEISLTARTLIDFLGAAFLHLS